jgi:hypothetical protein
MNHAAASTVNVVTEGLLLDHGETETRPMPAPSATNAKENAAATNAPAKTAAHDTPDTVSIAVSTAVTVDKGARVVTVACVMCSNLALRRNNETRALPGYARSSCWTHQ